MVAARDAGVTGFLAKLNFRQIALSAHPERRCKAAPPFLAKSYFDRRRNANRTWASPECRECGNADVIRQRRWLDKAKIETGNAADGAQLQPLITAVDLTRFTKSNVAAA